MSTLYELTSEYQALLELAEDPDADPQALADTLEGLDGEIEVKADNYARVIRQIEADNAGIKAEIDRLTRRLKTGDASVKRMKAALQTSMEATGKVKFKTPFFNFSIRKYPASLVIDGEVPEMFMTQPEPIINKTAIKDAIKQGHEFEFAHLEQSSGLSIR